MSAGELQQQLHQLEENNKLQTNLNMKALRKAEIRIEALEDERNRLQKDAQALSSALDEATQAAVSVQWQVIVLSFIVNKS